MASTKLLTVPGNEVAYVGAGGYPSGTNGRVLVIQAGRTATLRAKFALSRMASTNKGIHVKRVGMVYKFTEGTLDSVTNTLTKQSDSDAAAVTSTSITLDAASPVFDLTSPGAGQSSRGMQAVAGASLAAANADEANTASTSFLFTSALAANSAAKVIVEIIGVEIEYTDDEAEPSVSAVKTGAYTTVPADSGQEIQVDISGGSVTITLDAVDDSSDGCIWTVKVVAVDAAGTNAINVAPDAADAIVGLGLTGLVDGEAITISGPNVGDYVKLLSINATTPKVTVMEARGAWVEASP